MRIWHLYITGNCRYSNCGRSASIGWTVPSTRFRGNPYDPRDLLLRQELCWRTIGFAFMIAAAKKKGDCSLWYCIWMYQHYLTNDSQSVSEENILEEEKCPIYK